MKRSGAWQYDKFMSAKKQPNLKRTYQEGSVEGYIRGHLCPSNDRMRPGMNEQKAKTLEVSIDQVEETIGLDLYPNLVRLIESRPAEAVEAGR